MNAPRVRLRHRFFFAAMPPDDVAARIAAEMAARLEDARMIRSDRLHVTIDLSDDHADYPDALVAGLIAAGASVRAAAFDLAFDRIVASPHTVTLRPGAADPALDALHDSIVRAREAQGIAGRDGYAFAPHLTLAYRKSEPSSQAIPPIGWHVDQFVLVHSAIGQGRYDILASWPLQMQSRDEQKNEVSVAAPPPGGTLTP